MTINNSTTSTTSATACDTYSWAANGQTYTTSGTYTVTSTNAAGCTQTETLNLTINNSTSNTTNATACDTYSWSVNGSTYTSSGTYTATSTNAAGCTHIETLNLTINNSTSNTTNATACDTYSWSVNGSTYTSSGTYTVTSTNAAGCTHTETLNLTINNSTSNTTNATACDTYTWSVNGSTYTNSGTYTATSTNAAGCTHIETLNLTMNVSPTVTISSNNSPICAGANATFTLTGTTGAVVTYKLNNGANTTVTLVGGTATITVPTASINQVLTLVSVSMGTCSQNLSSTSTVTVNAIPNAPSITFSNPASASSTISACVGNTVTMVCNTPNVYEYIWYKNGAVVNYATTNNSYTVNVSATGTDVYTLAVTSIAGTCLSALSSPLTVVKSTQTATITPAGAISFCANTPTILNANVGTNNGYVWKRGASIVQVGGVSYTPVASGNHTVTVTDLNTGCVKSSAAVSITIKVTPTADAGADKTACAGSSVQIGSTGTSSNTYTWTPATGLSNAFVANPNCTPLSNTTYTVSVSNVTTGCTNTDVVVVTRAGIPPTPTLSNTTSPVCEGASVTLTTTAINASSINWYKNGVLLYNKPNTYQEVVSATTVSAVNYTTKTVGANGCLSSSSNARAIWVKPAATPSLTSNPAAVGNTITVCVPNGTSGNATLTASTTTASPTYAWLLGTSVIPGATGSTYNANVTTTNNNKVLSVRATYSNGCVKTSGTRTVTLITTGCIPKVGTDKEDANSTINADFSYTCYPNPTSDKLNVEIKNSLQTEGKLTLYNAWGKYLEQKHQLDARKCSRNHRPQPISCRGIFAHFPSRKSVKKS